jgi:antitoxin (DNA-binding transcriptional repressor) of toxin-antitoxin stability system
MIITESYDPYNLFVSFISYILYNKAPMYERVPVSEARDNWRERVSRAEFGKEATILTFRGKDVAAIVPISSVDLKALGPEKKAPASAKKPRKSREKPA